TVEKSSRERILEVVLEVDGRPVSVFGCDGVLCATPTGSTAYAFSAGGPLVWPQVEALLLVPSNAHALFARPMVIAPNSEVAIEVDPHGPPAVLECDGRRTFSLPPGARVEVARGATPVRMVRLDGQPFADRLVRKFDLPVRGWRGAPGSRHLVCLPMPSRSPAGTSIASAGSARVWRWDRFATQGGVPDGRELAPVAVPALPLAAPDDAVSHVVLAKKEE